MASPLTAPEGSVRSRAVPRTASSGCWYRSAASRTPASAQPPACGIIAKEKLHGPIRWASGTGTSGPAGSSRYGFALRLISPNERRTVMASSRPSSTSSYSAMWSSKSETPADVDEAAGRIGRQRHLAVAALHRQAAFDDRELALGGRRRGRARERHVPAQAVVARPVLELDADADERLAGPQLVRRRDIGGDRRRSPRRTRWLHRGGPLVASPDDELPSSGPVATASVATAERRLDDRVVRPAGRSCSCPRTHRHRPGARRRSARNRCPQAHGPILGRAHGHEPV